MYYMGESESEERRLLFDAKLKEETGIQHVYYDPPESMFIEYPAIVYKKTAMPAKYADNKKYINHIAYEVKVICEDPDSTYVDIVNSMRYSSHNRHYVADELHHDTFTIIF
jgi:hypothetical protein